MKPAGQISISGIFIGDTDKHANNLFIGDNKHITWVATIVHQLLHQVQCCSLVAINEAVTGYDSMYQGGGFLVDPMVVTMLGTGKGGSNQPFIPYAIQTAIHKGKPVGFNGILPCYPVVHTLLLGQGNQSRSAFLVRFQK